MAENLGSLYYEVDADTSSVLTAEAQVNKSLDKMSKDFAKADKAVRDFTNTQKTLGNTVNKSAQVMDKNGKILVDATNQYRELSLEAGNALHTINTQITKTAKGVNRGIRSMQGAAQNFSYQIQDIAVQLAGGQNPFLIAAQQIPQMLVGMGAAAAGIGALVAIFGGLFMVMNQNKKSAAELADEVKALSEEYDKLNKSTAQAYLIQADKLMPSLVKESAEINKLITEKEAQVAANNKLRDNYDESSKTYQKMSQASFSLGQELIDLKVKQEANEKSITDLTKKREAYSAVVDGDTETVKRNSKAYQDNQADLVKLQSALKAQVETIGMNSRELAIYTANMLGAKDADRQKINAAYDLIEAEQLKQKTLGELNSARGGLLNPTEQAIEKYAAEQDVFKSALEQKLITEQEYNALRMRSNEEYVEKLKALESSAGKSFADQMAKNGASMESFQASAVGAFTAFATGAQSGEDAMRGLATSILTQMVGALVQMGIASLLGQTTAAAGAVAAGATMATAYAPAAAMASLASFGANAAPAAAGISATVGLSQGLALAGGRLGGGYTAPNSMYQVNENGRPEMFSDGKNQFLMTGSRGGNVTSNNDLKGGGEPIINISVDNSMAGAQATATATPNASGGGDIRVTIKAVADNINSGGIIRKAITQSTTAQNKVTR